MINNSTKTILWVIFITHMFLCWYLCILHAQTRTNACAHMCTHAHLVSHLNPGSYHYEVTIVWFSVHFWGKPLVPFPGFSALAALCNNFCVCIPVCLCVLVCVSVPFPSSGTAVPNTRHTLQLTRWPLTSHLYTTTTLLDKPSERDVQYWPQINTHTNAQTHMHIHTTSCVNQHSLSQYFGSAVTLVSKNTIN